MGLFDGVKEAFGANSLERPEIESGRETPIDRWMGWTVVSENQQQQVKQQDNQAGDFLDAMDEVNYVSVQLSKPMGIIFEENDSEFGGIFVQSLKEGGAAEVDGAVKVTDQLIAVVDDDVSGLPFEDALNKVVESTGETTKLILFRGTAKQFYGPTGASKAWVQEFIAKGGNTIEAS